ncbi:MAG: GNAT family N-acetyltransferase [Alphaproteobacteria bacterium]|nr:GNAT family N-acetyltransferase [Alphaproteobacteria bacterium]
MPAPSRPPAFAVPVIETPRLLMRGLEAADAPALARIHGDAEVMRFLGGRTDDTLPGAYDKILLYVGHWVLHGCGKWAVVEKSSGRLVGRTGFIDAPYEWPGLELGWTFGRESWGKGYATESALAARDWAFTQLGVTSILSMIAPANAASQRVAARIGETPWNPYLHRDGAEQMLWAITRETWLSRSGAA